MDLCSGQLKSQCAINRDKELGSMKFSGKTINTVAMACFITMINLHGTSLAPTTAKFLKDGIVSSYWKCIFMSQYCLKQLVATGATFRSCILGSMIC